MKILARNLFAAVKLQLNSMQKLICLNNLEGQFVRHIIDKVNKMPQDIRMGRSHRPPIGLRKILGK